MPVSRFGPGMDSVAVIKEWNPPKQFMAETEEGPGTVATAWLVDARAGGTCVVRVVHRWFADSDGWDAEFEGHAHGWAATFFRILRLYLSDLSGQSCSAFDLAAFSTSPGPVTWRSVKSGPRIDGTARRVTSAPGAPTLSGAVEPTEFRAPCPAAPSGCIAVQDCSVPEGRAGQGDVSAGCFFRRVDEQVYAQSHVLEIPCIPGSPLMIRCLGFGDKDHQIDIASRNRSFLGQ